MGMNKTTKALLKVYRQYKVDGLNNKQITQAMAEAGYKKRDGEPVNINTIQHLSKISYRMKRPYTKKSSSKETTSLVRTDQKELTVLILASDVTDSAKVHALKAIYA